MNTRPPFVRPFLAFPTVIAISLLIGASLALAQDRPSSKSARQTSIIAVWDFTLEGIGQHEGRAVTNRLRSELVNTGLFRVMSRDQLGTLLGEQDLSLALGDPRKAIEAGRLKGVDFVVTGTLVAVAGAIQTTVEMIDGSTAEIMRSITPRPYRGDFIDYIDSQVPWFANQVAGVAEAARPPEVAVEASRWQLYTGIAVLALAVLNQYQTQALAEEAGDLAADARRDMDFDKYERAKDLYEEARKQVSYTIILGMIGAVLLVQYATESSAMDHAGRTTPSEPPLTVGLQPDQVVVNYVYRW